MTGLPLNIDLQQILLHLFNFTILFGALYNLPLFIKGLSLSEKKLFAVIPYVVTILVLIFTSIRKKREHQPPASLGLPYFREDR
jgi:simple sugar transport system permease protein